MGGQLSSAFLALCNNVLRLWQGIPASLRPLLILGVGALLVLAFVRPFGGTSDGPEDGIAAEWNRSISRLGLQAVFPPEEDVYVGDIWATVVDPCDPDTASGSGFARSACRSPFRGEAIRIGHVDLSAKIRTDPKLPVFEATASKKKDEDYRTQSTDALPAGQPNDTIRLSLAGFPGVTIERTVRKTGSTAWGLASLFASRQNVEHENVLIPVAETYGVTVETAFIALDDFCNDKTTNIYCTDAYLRRLMSFVLGDDVLRIEDGRYALRLQLQLVARTFLTREIDLHRTETNAAGVTVDVSPDGARSGSGTGGPPPAPEVKGTPETPAQPAAVKKGFANAWSRESNWGVDTAQIYQRPLVFGYRPITFAVVPSCPRQVGATKACG